MSNYGATTTLDITYTGISGESVTPPSDEITALYQEQNAGWIDVPDATASSTTYSVPFGDITVDATGGYVKNTTGQDLDCDINGAGVAFSIPDGGRFEWTNPGAAATPILSIDLTTTALQSGDGKILYRFFGDPTP